MAHDKIIQAVRIYLDLVVTEDTTLGIYTSGTSEIRLSEETLAGTVLAWKSGLIAKNGISAITEGADLTTGGAPAEYDGLTLTLINTNQYLNALDMLGIYLGGCKCEVYEFRGTEANSDATSASVIFTGAVEDINWTECTLDIPIKNMRYKRNACITTESADGTTYPVTFGKLYPRESTDSLAKFVRSQNDIDETTYNNSFFDAAGLYPEIVQFPVTKVSTTVRNIFKFEVRCANTRYLTVFPTNVYAKVVSGAGAGQVRRVSFYSCAASDNEVTIALATVFGIPLSDLNDSTRSWVQIIAIDRKYNADQWPCKSFLDNSGAEITQTPEIYLEDNGEVALIPDGALECKNVSAENNELKIESAFTTNNIDTIESVKIVPITDIYAVDSIDLSNWTDATHDGSLWTKYDDGVYCNASDLTSVAGALTDVENCYDRDSTTYATFNLTYSAVSNTSLILKCIGFTFPTPPDIDWDEVYIGFKMKTLADYPWNSYWSAKTFSVVTRRWKYFVDVHADGGIIQEITALDKGNVSDIPDFYFSDVTSNLNIDYFISSTVDDIKGHANFKLDNITKVNYSSYVEGMLVFGRHTQYAGMTDSLKLYELCLMFKKSSQSLDADVYSPLAGRIYNDTWDSRKTQTDQMLDPVDIVEHCKRLQNWSDRGGTPVTWGLQYCTDSQIATQTDQPGYFDDPDLTSARAYRPAFQIFDRNDAFTDAICKDLCDTFNLMVSTAADGTERIFTTELTSPTETITFADVIGNIGSVVEPKTQDVYVQPAIYYRYNSASDEYDASIVISDIVGYQNGDGSWATTSSGFQTQADAESVMDVYKALNTRFRQIEKCPESWSQRYQIVEYADAVAWLKMKGEWMGKKRISLSVPYSKGSAYYFGMHVIVQLPHQTDSYEVESLIERVTKDKNNNLVTLDLILLEAYGNYYQDTINTGDEWEDNTATGDEYQDIV